MWVWVCVLLVWFVCLTGVFFVVVLILKLKKNNSGHSMTSQIVKKNVSPFGHLQQ